LGVVSARAADSLMPKDSTAAILKEIRDDSLAQGKGLQVFGLEVFRRRTREFAPALAGPIDPGYVLGPGDLLVLVITGDVEKRSTHYSIQDSPAGRTTTATSLGKEPVCSSVMSKGVRPILPFAKRA